MAAARAATSPSPRTSGGSGLLGRGSIGRPDSRRSERAGWLVTQKRRTPETASSFEETAGFHRNGETVQQELVCRRLRQLRQVPGLA